MMDVHKTGFKVRYVQVALLFFLMTMAYAIRTFLSVAIVAMVDSTASKNPDIPTFNWNGTGVILSSFYWSYAVLQFFAGPIAQAFSPKWILFVTMFINSALCLIMPALSIHIGSVGLIVCRVLQGITQGFMLPLTHNMLGKWAPTQERSWIVTTVYSGCSFGTIISMPITSYISASHLGWPVSFYFFGAFGLVWCIFWSIFSADRPGRHKSISMQERKFIETSLGQEDETLNNVKVPWKAIFTSLPYWAIIVAAIGECWGSTFLITEIPTYLSKVVKIDVEKNGLYSSAPYVVAAVFTVLFGPLADYLILKNVTSRKTSRRIFHGVGSILPAIALIGLAYEESLVGTAFLLIISISLNGAMYCGYNVNHIDISPRFSGILFGVSNGIGQTLAIVAPLLVELLVYAEEDKVLWRSMFVIAAIIYAATAVFFICFLSAERQWWDHVVANRNSIKDDGFDVDEMVKL